MIIIICFSGVEVKHQGFVALFSSDERMCLQRKSLGKSVLLQVFTDLYTLVEIQVPERVGNASETIRAMVKIDTVKVDVSMENDETGIQWSK